MLHYEGKRTGGECEVVKSDGTEATPLPLRQDLWDHSPTGFEWGYGGSGPAQLSLAMLADALGDDAQAVKLHQPFKWEVISRLPQDEWQLLAEDVVATAQRLAQERAGQPRRAEDENIGE